MLRVRLPPPSVHLEAVGQRGTAAENDPRNVFLPRAITTNQLVKGCDYCWWEGYSLISNRGGQKFAGLGLLVLELFVQNVDCAMRELDGRNVAPGSRCRWKETRW